jgi:hypothetical protein
MKGSIAGLIGFIGFVAQFLLTALGEKMGLPQDKIVSFAPLLLIICIVILWVGIMSTIKNKGENLLLGFFLCLIAPLGWLIALFLKDKRALSEQQGVVPHRKFFWVSLATLFLGIVFIFMARPNPPTPEVLDSLRATHRLLMEKGAAINTKRNFNNDDFISLTGLDIGARLRAEGSAKMDHHAYGCLSLANTGITDDELSRLKVFANLRELDLSNTKISDAGIDHLIGLRKIEKLSLENTRVSDAGRNKLKASLTNCAIK